jgi:hypothetical protein
MGRQSPTSLTHPPHSIKKKIIICLFLEKKKKNHPTKLLNIEKNPNNLKRVKPKRKFE